MKYFVLLIAIFSLQTSFAQDVKSDNEQTVLSENQAYDFSAVESIPEFPGGIKAFYKYIGNSFRIPDVKEFKGGKVFASFVIDKDGSLTNIKIVRDLGFGTAEEAVRVLQNCPKWKPGKINDKAVKVAYMLPITLGSF